MIKFQCPSCDAILRVSDDKAGRSGKCPSCAGAITVPAAEAAREPANGAQVAAAGRSRGSSAQPAGDGSSRHDVPWPESFGRASAAPAPPPLGGACPSCQQPQAASACVCVRCGIRLPSGRPLVTARGLDPDEVHVRAESVIRKVSWLVWIGLSPIHSEGGGGSRPRAVWTILGLTVIVSLVFLALEITGSPRMQRAKNLMLWPGQRQASPELLLDLYLDTTWGDTDAFVANLQEIEPASAPAALRDFSYYDRLLVGHFTPSAPAIVAAHERLSPNQQAVGRFSAIQLVSHALLHGGLMHLAGNMVFFIVMGLAVNRAIGNLWTAVMYPLLAIGAAVFQLAADSGGEPIPMLGASGAVMGIAGMYLVLFPAQKLYMAAWCRMGLLLGFKLLFWVFRLPGFIVVLAYIGMDVLWVSIGSQSNVAYWAHIGGFLCGAVAAAALLAARQVHTGSDALSMLLGRHAWAIIGTPASHHTQPVEQRFIPLQQR